MIKNSVKVTIDFQDDTEILALIGLQNFTFHFSKGLMHSFPMMYNTMGSKVESLVGGGNFLQKNEI